MAAPTQPPGWYPDPAGSGGQRWWDGTQWTDHVQPPPPAQPVPVAAPPPAAPLAAPYPGGAPATGATAPATDGTASSGKRVVAVLIGVAFLLIALAGLAFMIVVIGAERCSQVTIAEALAHPNKRCVSISSGAQTIYLISGWAGTLAAFLVLPFTIVYAARGRSARLWVMTMIVAAVLLGGTVGIYLLDAKAKVF